MEAWEYTFRDVSGLTKDVDQLNRLGAEGWEAVGLVSTWGAKEWRFVHPVLLMKRRLDLTSSPTRGGQSGTHAR